MKAVIIFSVTVILFLSAALSCGSGKDEKYGEWVRVQDLDMLIIKKSPLIIDIRTAEEFSKGHIAGALNLPLAGLERNLSGLDTERPVLIYCNTVNRVRASIGIFKNRGFQEVYVLHGGYQALRASGYPLEK